MYRDLLTRAQGVASTPYQAYTGDLTAPVNAQQQTGIANINANAGYAAPNMAQATGLAQGAANPLTAGQIQSYLNPYTQNVVDTTNAQMAHDNASQMASLQGNQIAQGALGGNATGVAKAILAGQQGRTMAGVDANLYNQGYQGALQTAAQQYQQNPLAAGNAIANYGISGQNAALTGATAQVGAGSLQQQTEQANLNALYGQYQQAQAYPYQQTQWLAGLGTGVGSNLGGTSSGSTTGPAPNQTAQYLGLGLTAAGMLSDRDAKEDIERIGKMNDGTPMYRFRYKGSPDWHVGPMAQEVEKRNPDAVSRGVDGYRYVDMHEATEDSVRRASGGGVMPWGDAKGWIPTMGISAGSGAPHASAPSAPSQSSGFDPSKMASGLAGATKGLKGLDWGGLTGGGGFSGDSWGGGSFLGGDAFGGSSAAPMAGLDASDYGEGFAGGGAVMSDEDPVGIAGGQRFAQGSPYQIRPNQDGTHSVINVRTGQIHFTGPPSGASNAQATLNSRNRASGGGVAGYAGGGSPFDDRYDASFPARNPADVQDWLSPQPMFGEGEELPRKPSFEDRAAPVTRAIASGDFDPVGANSTDFAGPPGMQASNRGVVPMPGARPDDAGAPVVASDDEEDTAPVGVAGRAGAAPSGRVMAFGPDGAPNAYGNLPDAITRPGGEERGGFGLLPISPNASHGLLTAGLGMLASRSPFLGNAVGEGGLAGVSAYGKAEENDRKVAAEAAALSREQRQQNVTNLMNERKQTESERHNAATESTAAKNLDRTKFMPAGSAITADGSYHPLVLDQASGKVIDAVTGAPPTANDKVQPKDQKGGPISDDDARAIAEYYVKTGDNSRLNGLGVTSAARQAVQKHIREVMNENKVTPEEMGTRVAEFAGRKAGQRTLGTMEAKMGAAAFEAEGAIKQARGVIERLPRTSFLPFNQLLQGYSNKTLNPDQTELYGRTQAIVNTYAAVMARGANVTTDSSRHHAEGLLNTAGNAETYNRMLDTMLQEIAMAKDSPAKMREFYSKTYGPKAVQPEGGGAAPAGGAPKFTPPPGAIPRQYQGKTYYYDPTTKQPYPGQ